MNERIKELYLEASEQFKIVQEQGLPAPYQTRAFAEKFAELIIRECAEVCMKEIDTGWVMAPKSPWMAKQILEHFGVKE